MKDCVVGIDIGGTKLAAGLFDRQGNFVARGKLPTGSDCHPDQVIEAAVQITRSLLQETGIGREQVEGVGVGIAGHVNHEQGIVLTNSNLPEWDYHPLREILEKRLALPVILDNDANFAAWGEFRFGAGRGSRHMCYLTFSTGCGMGIVIDGKLYRGATGTAGEIGHTVVNPDGPLCSCGKRGCLMSYACGLALDRMARDSIGCSEETLLRSLCGDCPEHVRAETIAEAARQGDPVALRILTTAGHYFGIGLSTVVQVLNPDTIVIGGGLTHIGPMLLDPCIRALNDNIHPVLRDSARVVLSELWNDAGVMGAGAWIWERNP
ncbi:MAG TPA: ROK family protein [Anaerolineaceae bacterium]|nr:ROK family protein [Anaerolineaceae bacterium]